MRTSSARRLIAAPLHSVGYRQEAHCHDCCPRSSLVADIHDRMPVILAPGDYGTAGGSNTDPFEASALPVMIIDGEAVVVATTASRRSTVSNPTPLEFLAKPQEDP